MKTPQVNRITWGAVSALLALLAVSVMQRLWITYTSSELPSRMERGAFFGVALGLFWLGDYFGAIRAPYTPSALSMLTADVAAEDPGSPRSGDRSATASEHSHPR